MSPHARRSCSACGQLAGASGVTTSGLCALALGPLGDDLVPAERQVRRQRERRAADERGRRPSGARRGTSACASSRRPPPASGSSSIHTSTGSPCGDVHRRRAPGGPRGRRRPAAARGATACPRRGRGRGRPARATTRRRPSAASTPRSVAADARRVAPVEAPVVGGDAVGGGEAQQGVGRVPGVVGHTPILPERHARTQDERSRLRHARRRGARSRQVSATRRSLADHDRTRAAHVPAGPPRATSSRTCTATRVADPYRWLEDATADETRGLVAARRTTCTPRTARRVGAPAPFATEPLTARLRELLGAGFVGAPAWRGERRFFSRRAGDQEHAVRGGRRRATHERVLIDPIALDPAGTTTLDAWQPSKEGHLLAYQLSDGRHRGERAARARRRDRRARRRPDRPRPLLPRRLAARRRGVLLRAPARRPSSCPTTSAQYHRRVWLHRVGHARDRRRRGLRRRAGPRRTTTASPSRATGAGSSSRRPPGTAPRTDVWIADLRRLRADGAGVRRGRGRARRARPAPWVGRDGRLYVHTDLDAPRGRLAVDRPDRARASSTGRRWSAQDAEAVLEDVAFTDGGGDDTTPTLLLVVVAPARGLARSRVHDPRDGRRGTGAVRAARARLDLRAGRRAPRAAARSGSPTPTTRRRPACTASTRRTGETSLWAAPPGAVADLPGRARPAGRGHQRQDGTTVRAFVVARADLLDADGRPLAPAPTILYGYGGFQISLDPGYSATHARVGRGRRRVRRRQPARRRRGGRGLAPRGHARAQAERVRRLPRGRRLPRRAGLDHARRSSRAGAARTAACSSAPP